MATDALADFLEVWGFEGDSIIFSDGSLGFGLSASPLDVSCWDDEKINGFSERSSQLLNGLPPGIDIQFIFDIGSGNHNVIERHKTLQRSGAGDTAVLLSHKRSERYLELDKEGLLPRHRLMIFVRKPLSKPILKKPSIFSLAKKFQPISEMSLKEEISVFLQVRDNLGQSLRALGIESEVITADSLLDLLYQQWNPSRQIPRGKYDPEDVRSSVVLTDVSLSERGFSLSDMHYRVLSLKMLPDETFASMASVLGELPFDSRLFLSISVPDQHKELEKLQTQRRIAFSMARGRTTGVSDIESESKFQDLETLIEEMVAEGEKVFRVSLNIVLRSKYEDELERNVNDALMKIRELGGAEAMEETVASFDIFAELALPNSRARERAKYMKTSNLSDFLPIYAPWPGHPTPRILLRSRLGSLVAFDPFSPELTNYNHIVSGGSGSGKSFLTNILLLHVLKENPRVFIVDIGGSYRKLCENLSGQYIPLGIGNALSLNPFDLSTGERVPSSHKIKFLLGLVELMTKEEHERQLPKLDRAEIEEAIQRVYETKREPALSALRQVLLDHPSSEIKRFGRILTPWCGNTPYGQFVDAPTNISLTSPIVVFDLKGMEAYPDLQAVTLFIITDFVWREVQHDRDRMKFLVFDECWKLLESQAGLSFIEEVFRTFRKYYAGAIAISQNIDDFAKSKISGAILSNSATKWVLMQKGADQKRLAEVLQLNPNEERLVSSLRQERGVYSESFLMAQDQRAVVAVESTPLEYWIATTDPRDLSLIQKKQDEEPQRPELEILAGLAEEYPKGAACLR